jgi:hypothetical protein
MLAEVRALAPERWAARPCPYQVYQCISWCIGEESKGIIPNRVNRGGNSQNHKKLLLA